MICNDLAYVIHSRPYRESSLILSLFCREYGLVSAVCRGGKSVRKSLPRSFSLLQSSWVGKAELKTLKSFEILEAGFITGKSLYVGLYLNELLERLACEGQPLMAVFDRYHHLVRALQQGAGDAVEPLLRMFEYTLLSEMGYGFALNLDASSGEPVIADSYYEFVPLHGLVLSGALAGRERFPGDHLLEISEMRLSDSGVRQTAKRLMRLALAPHLGRDSIRSRELFRGSFT